MAYATSAAFGTRVSPITTPNPYADLSKVYPNLSGTNAQLSGDILSQLKGQLSPQTMQMIQDAGASYGVASGMPGSGMARNRTLRDLGIASEDVQNKGIQNYISSLPTISRTQTVSPELQSEISYSNAVNAAAPNPAAAANYSQQLFNQYLSALNPAPLGFNAAGRAVSGGKYQFGYSDPSGRFHGGEHAPSIGI